MAEQISQNVIWYYPIHFKIIGGGGGGGEEIRRQLAPWRCQSHLKCHGDVEIESTNAEKGKTCNFSAMHQHVRYECVSSISNIFTPP